MTGGGLVLLQYTYYASTPYNSDIVIQTSSLLLLTVILGAARSLHPRGPRLKKEIPITHRWHSTSHHTLDCMSLTI